MANRSRKQSQADIYHVTVRGVSRALIFEDDADRNFFLAQLSKMLESTGGELLAWCLMSNHAHLLFRMEIGKLSEGMKRFESSYATYFNKRHSRIGHLFQDRFGSEPINDDAYLLAVVRYIHANPEKAGLATASNYAWSSYREYLGEPDLCSTELVLGLLGGLEQFREFHASTESSLISLQDGKRLHNMEDTEIRAAVSDAIGEKTLRDLASMERSERDPIIADLLCAGLSVRQIERITGIGRGVIQRISRTVRNGS